MADEPIRNLQHGKLTISDSAGNSVEVVGEDGDLSWEETNETVDVMDRGKLDQLAPGPETPVTLSFSLHYKYAVSDGAEPTSPYEAVRQIGAASAWESVNTIGGVYTVNLKFEIENPDESGEGEVVVFRNVPTPGISFEEGEDFDVMSFDGKAFVTKPSIYRGTTTTAE